MCMIRRVCLAMVPSEPGGEASVNTHKQAGEGNGQSRDSSSACCGWVCQPPLLCQAFPLHHCVTMTLVGNCPTLIPLSWAQAQPWPLVGIIFHPVLVSCLGEHLFRRPSSSPVMDGLASSGPGLAPGHTGGVGQNGCALPHRSPLAGQTPHSVHSIGRWAPLLVLTQGPGALILGHWALSLVWSHWPALLS